MRRSLHISSRPSRLTKNNSVCFTSDRKTADSRNLNLAFHDVKILLVNHCPRIYGDQSDLSYRAVYRIDEIRYELKIDVDNVVVSIILVEKYFRIMRSFCLINSTGSCILRKLLDTFWGFTVEARQYTGEVVSQMDYLY